MVSDPLFELLRVVVRSRSTPGAREAAHLISAHQGAPGLGLEEIERLLERSLRTGSTTSSIQHLERATASVAESHTQAPPRLVLAEVLSLRRRTHGLIENQRRLRHKRTLCAIESALLAHACLLFGDLKHNHIAERYGHAALAFAEEAGVGQALARTALAKTLRWEDRFTESADMARIGFESKPVAARASSAGKSRANAAALMGDTRRAREALARAMPRSSPLRLIQGCPRGRSRTDVERSSPCPSRRTQATRTLLSAQPDGRLRLAQGSQWCWPTGSDQSGGWHRAPDERLTGRYRQGDPAGLDTPLRNSESQRSPRIWKSWIVTYVPLVGDTSRWHARCAGTFETSSRPRYPCLRE